MSTYLWVDLLSLSIPLVFSFSPWFPFRKKWKYFLPACLAMAIFFLIWDIQFTRMGIWGFNPKHLSGLALWGLPLEEYLFFFCIPYACVFTYFVIKQQFPNASILARPILSALAVALAILAATHTGQWYTVTTFSLLVILLFYLLMRKVDFLDHFLLMYLITLVPFFVVNGVLTGSWIEEEVVWYNDAENFGLRLGTIPVEDTMYGMLMLLMTVAIMEGLEKRSY